MQKEEVITDNEKDYMKRLHENVIFVEAKDLSFYQLAEMFSKFGDIKIVRESKNHYYIDF